MAEVSLLLGHVEHSLRGLHCAPSPGSCSPRSPTTDTDLSGRGRARVNVSGVTMASRRCPGRYCPTILTGGERYCPAHMAEYEGKRGSSKERGYGAMHRVTRASWKARLDKGEVIHCARCGERITIGQAWALDHDDHDRTRYLGPSHASCNNAAGGRAAHRYE